MRMRRPLNLLTHGLRAMRRASLGIAVVTPTVAVPVVLAIYLSSGITATEVCEISPSWDRTWESPAAREALLRESAASRARAAGVKFCSYRWDGAIPTVSIVGADPDLCHPLFRASLLVASTFGAVGYRDLHAKGGVAYIAAHASSSTAERGRRANASLLALAWASMVCLALAGVINVTHFNAAHNGCALGFYVTNSGHTWALWRMQRVAAHRTRRRLGDAPPSLAGRWCLQVDPKAHRPGSSSLKEWMAILWTMCFGGALVVLGQVFAPVSWATWFSSAAVLEWLATELVNTSVLIHYFDMRQLRLLEAKLSYGQP